jgi:sialate O-acetylesterase
MLNAARYHQKPMKLIISAKGADARHQTTEELRCPSGGPLETATVLRVFSKTLFALALLSNLGLHAEVRLPKILSSHMVLQRDRPVHFWGWADPGEEVTVGMDGQNATATADKLGKWSLYLLPHAPGGPFTVSVKASNQISIDDVMIGDVWFASGQSNMEMPLKGFPGNAVIKNSEAEIQGANQPKLRLLRIQKKTSNFPLSDYQDTWTACTPQTAADFSAVAYFFGRIISDKENVTVGLIDSTWGGTPAEAWTSFHGLTSDASLMPVFAAWGTMMNEQTDMWLIKEADRRADEAAEKAHAQKPKRAWRAEPASWAPAALYNGMVAPAIGYGIKGAIWYQGEANTGATRAPLYDKVFGGMITDWRRHWNQGDFPFFFVQLANYKSSPEALWPTVREAQRRTLSLTKTGMAVTIDVGDPGNIHPADKQSVGERLALAARAIAYGESIEFSGPMFRQAGADGHDLRVWFDHAEGLSTKGGGVPEGFEVAGEDRKYKPATARLDGKSVVVTSSEVAQPTYVRYGWKDVPTVNLCNGAGLPASPFSSEEMLPATN